MTLVPLPTKCAKSCPCAENLNILFTEKGGKFEFSAQGQCLPPFVKIPSELKPPFASKKVSFHYLEILDGLGTVAGTKSQLISKCLFGTYLQFFQKMNKKIRANYYGTSTQIVFIRFLEELKTPKKHFEIN